MLLRALFLLNAVVTFTVGIVLFCAPQRIAGTVGLRLPQDPGLLADLLGASEIGLGALCILGARARTPEAARMACIALSVFQAASAFAGIRSYNDGVQSNVLLNVVARVVMTLLFAWAAVKLAPRVSAPA